MPTQIIYIDPVDKLIIEKDSSLFFAHELRRQGANVKIMLKNDLFLSTKRGCEVSVYDFESSLSDGFYLDHFILTNRSKKNINQTDTIHMRLEPPFDVSYMRSLWILNFFKHKSNCKIINDPTGIFVNNEKITSLYSSNYIDTFIGASEYHFLAKLKEYKQDNISEIILKPLDLFQGIGVEKVSIRENFKKATELFTSKVQSYNGPIMVQPFCNEVTSGEIRAIFYNSKLIGAIKKIPVEGSYLANIAQGANFKKQNLNDEQQKACEHICTILGQNVPWVAFDIIGDKISEVNITCPGLLVEVSSAENKNLARIISEMVVE